MKLKDIIEIKATLVLKTGLHIGAGNAEMSIGGIDNEVVKNPLTKEPYIPGSSLKGKIRSLLEWRSGEVKKANPFDLDTLKKAEENKEAVKDILRLFGVVGHTDNEKSLLEEIKPSRLAFWDCNLNDKFKNEHKDKRSTEAKYENTIDRITATTINGGLRQTERVPAGAKFDFKLTVRRFEGDSDELLELVLKGLRLLELDSLGGSGSRGYGKVEFQDLTVDGNTRNLSEINPFA